jgi:hypothetical protein
VRELLDYDFASRLQTLIASTGSSTNGVVQAEADDSGDDGQRVVALVTILERLIEHGLQQQAQLHALTLRVHDTLDAVRSEVSWLRGDVGVVRGEITAARSDISSVRSDLQGNNLRYDALSETNAYLARRLHSLVATTDRLADDTAELLKRAREAPPLGPSRSAAILTTAEQAERRIDVPYALRALANLTKGATVLDVGFGGCESAVALSLASMGYSTTAVDVRPYPFSHPRLEIVEAPLERWEPKGRAFDAIIALSSLAQFGVSADCAPPSEAADLDAMQRLRELSRPGGLLILSVPFGPQVEVRSSKRVYDEERLARLLGGWRVVDKSIVCRRDAVTWEIEEAATAQDTSSRFALITAQAP